MAANQQAPDEGGEVIGLRKPATFPPPLRGRVREGVAATVVRVATPLSSSPPQGGESRPPVRRECAQQMARHTRRMRCIQYAAASRLIPSVSGILDHPLSRVTTAVVNPRSAAPVAARFPETPAAPRNSPRAPPMPDSARRRTVADAPLS